MEMGSQSYTIEAITNICHRLQLVMSWCCWELKKLPRLNLCDPCNYLQHKSFIFQLHLLTIAGRPDVDSNGATDSCEK